MSTIECAKSIWDMHVVACHLSFFKAACCLLGLGYSLYGKIGVEDSAGVGRSGM